MGFLTGSTRTGAGGGSSSAPTRKTSEEDLNQFNLQLKSNPVYQKFMADNGLVDQGRGVTLTRGQQGALQDRLVESGMTIPGGMHIDQAGNFNQKNRLARNTAIAAGIGAGGYFAAPAIAGAFGGGGGAAGGAAAGGSAAGGSAAIPTLGSTVYGTGMGIAPSLAGSTAAGAGSMAAGAGAAAGGAAGGSGGIAGGSGIWGAIKGNAGSMALRGGGALFGSLMARKAQADAMKRSPEEQAALKGAGGAGSQLASRGSAALDSGQDAMAGPMAYWKTLLGGSRARMAQATAGPRAAITDVFRGAERNLEHSGVRGAQRDVATAELGRNRAGAIAGLTTGMQPMAAEALAGMGGQQSELGGRMLGQSGNIFSSLLSQGSANRIYARGEGQDAGNSWGSLIFDMISGAGKR